MTIGSKLKILFAAGLLSGSAAASADGNEKSASGLHFWDNPDIEHVSTAWPIDDDDLVDIRAVPKLEEGFIDTAPADRNDGIIVGELGVDGGNKEMIVKLAQEISGGQHGNIDSLLISQKGKLLFESYFNSGRINLTHPQASATKTYSSLALGRTIQLGYLTMADLDKPIISFLKDLDPTKFVEGAERVTLHRAMAGHTGISINDEQREAFDKYPERVKGQKLAQAIFEQSGPITPESQSSFKYDNYATPLVMQVIEAVVPGTAEDFIKNELLGKMGITTYEWRMGLGGLPAGGWKSSFSSRAMLKFGTLAMNKGQWNGEQLIPEEYITKAISRIAKPGEDVDVYGGGADVSNQGYGYFIWNADMKVGDKSYYSASASGGGGQFIILIEELDLVIVVTAGMRDPKTLQITAERILPAFVQSDLQGPYLGQTPPGLNPEPFAPGIVSTSGWEYGLVFKPGMEELYFLRENTETQKQETVVFQNRNNQWQESVFSPRLGQPFISPDGKTMHLGRRYKELTEAGWSETKKLGEKFQEIPIMRLTASSEGTYVFDEGVRDGNGVLRYSRVVDGKREDPKPLGEVINSGSWNAHPFIAPDESYILWDGKREGGYGDSDIYLSFRQQDGSWGEAINLGDKINTDAWEAAASVTPDGKYLFFNRNMGSDKFENVDIFWVDAQVIENLRPKR